MSTSMISKTIAKHDLQPGDTMRDIHGEAIAGSIVVDRHSFIHRDDGPHGGFRLEHERPIHGDEQSLFLSDSAIRALQGLKVD